MSELKLPLHQQRVLDEKRELDGNLEKLKTFFDNSFFANLDETERFRLKVQSVLMQGYSDILACRIEAFAPLTEGR